MAFEVSIAILNRIAELWPPFEKPAEWTAQVLAFTERWGGRVMYHMIPATDHPEAFSLMLRAYRKVSGGRTSGEGGSSSISSRNC